MKTTSPETKEKLRTIREAMRMEKIETLRLRGVDWFAWATDGGDSSVIFSNETGIADVLIQENEAWILTNQIEHARLLEEEVSPEFKITSFSWQNQDETEIFVNDLGGKVYSDRPKMNEFPLPLSIHHLKWTLSEAEENRYRALGRDASEAATDTLYQAHPEMTEWELAGLAAHALWKRGIHPLLTLVGGEDRGNRHRHTVAQRAPLGSRAMLVICGRRDGLFANFTRHVFFREPRNDEKKWMKDLIEIEAEAISATQELKSLDETYQRIKSRYESLNYDNEINLHHQGGPTGYLSREIIANGRSKAVPHPALHRAFAWNPSLSGGAKIEDTLLLNGSGEIEVLTSDPRWPTEKSPHGKRPSPLIRL
jgi:hypothetical protein